MKQVLAGGWLNQKKGTEMNDLPIIDRNEEENAVLVRLKNDLFDTVLLVYNIDEENEEAYALTDMQGRFPTSFDEVADYDWCRLEDINF